MMLSIELLFCGKGSAEDEFVDGAARLAKLRPMRVEMHCNHWNDDCKKIGNGAAFIDVACNVYTTLILVPMNAMHCNGQRGDNLIEDDPRRPPSSSSG